MARGIVIWWDDSPGESPAAWAFDHPTATMPGGDEFCEANDAGLGPDADIRDLLPLLRKAVGPRGYCPRAHKWTFTAGQWVAPPKN